RAAQGYTVAEIILIASADPNLNSVFTTGQDWDGTWPFNGNDDPTTTPNATFWARRDYLFNSAKTNGIPVVASITGTGPSGPAASWTNTQWSAYGTFLGNRYKTQPNIIWTCGDGIIGSTMTTGFANWRTAIRATGDTHTLTTQCNNEQSSRWGF